MCMCDCVVCVSVRVCVGVRVRICVCVHVCVYMFGVRSCVCLYLYCPAPPANSPAAVQFADKLQPMHSGIALLPMVLRPGRSMYFNGSAKHPFPYDATTRAISYDLSQSYAGSRCFSFDTPNINCSKSFVENPIGTKTAQTMV